MKRLGGFFCFFHTEESMPCARSFFALLTSIFKDTVGYSPGLRSLLPFGVDMKPSAVEMLIRLFKWFPTANKDIGKRHVSSLSLTAK